jgi:hypothetical protein
VGGKQALLEDKTRYERTIDCNPFHYINVFRKHHNRFEIPLYEGSFDERTAQIQWLRCCNGWGWGPPTRWGHVCRRECCRSGCRRSFGPLPPSHRTAEILSAKLFSENEIATNPSELKKDIAVLKPISPIRNPKKKRKTRGLTRQRRANITEGLGGG